MRIRGRFCFLKLTTDNWQLVLGECPIRQHAMVDSRYSCTMMFQTFSENFVSVLGHCSHAVTSRRVTEITGIASASFNGGTSAASSFPPARATNASIRSMTWPKSRSFANCDSGVGLHEFVQRRNPGTGGHVIGELSILSEWIPEQMEPGTIFVLENAGDVGDKDDP